MKRFALLVIALFVALMAGSGASARIDGGNAGVFDQGCEFSHSLPDDPIIYPGKRGASHMHDFFGFRRTDANTRQDEMLDDLRESEEVSTCTEGGSLPKKNASGYWTPSLYVNGKKVDPRSVHVYYNNYSQKDVKAFPAGFRMIGGDPDAPPEQQRGKVWWWCGGYNDKVFDRIPEDCAEYDLVNASIQFPTCWDGRLDSRDHRSHVVYQQDYHAEKCPEGHRRQLPRIAMHIHYNVKDAIGRRLRPNFDVMTLASGPITSLHADYLFAWDPDRLRVLVDRCLNARRDCKQNPPGADEPEGELRGD